MTTPNPGEAKQGLAADQMTMVEKVARAIMEAQPYNLSPNEAMNCAQAAIAVMQSEEGRLREALRLIDRECDRAESYHETSALGENIKLITRASLNSKDNHNG